MLQVLVVVALVGSAVGSPVFRYDQEDQGHFLDGHPGVDVNGGYYYQTPDKTMHKIDFTANDLGYIAAGDSLPSPPAQPEVEPLIQPEPVDFTAEVAAARAEHLQLHAEPLVVPEQMPFTDEVAQARADFLQQFMEEEELQRRIAMEEEELLEMMEMEEARAEPEPLADVLEE